MTAAPYGGGQGYRINQPAYPDTLLRGLDLKGQIPEQVAGDVSPVFVMDDFLRPEFWWLRRGSRWLAEVQGSAVAGQFTIVEAALSTAIPVGGLLALVEQVSFTNYGAAALTIGLALRPLPRVSAFVLTEFCNSDDRQAPFTVAAPVSNVPGLLMGSTTSATQEGVDSGRSMRVTLAVNETKVFSWPFVVSGRAVLRAAAGAVNSSFGMGLLWREREALPTERA